MTKLIGFIKVASLVVLIASSSVFARDLGVIGVTYPIIERDLIEVIHERIQEKTKSGELDALNKELKETAKQRARRPLGVLLPTAQVYRAIEINPIYTVDKDITDADGKVIYKAGTQINPLEVKPLTKTLCFIDGDDPEQVKWLQNYCAKNRLNKLILVNGDYLALSNQLNLRIYFDQRGYLVGRFGIKAVPAVIRQSGQVLYVEEFPVK
jgi:conjugal transfer pilus assembly protein TraW